MPDVRTLAQFMFGHEDGFWYAHPLGEIEVLSNDQLFAVPGEGALCILWQVGHIAHRERVHITRICQGLSEDGIPEEYDVFGDTWVPADELRETVGIDEVLDWARDVRRASLQYIEALTAEDMERLTGNPDDGLTVAHWLMITAAHGALHIGRIQALRAWLEGDEERAC